jgi:hypothetical protein
VMSESKSAQSDSTYESSKTSGGSSHVDVAPGHVEGDVT